MKDYAGLRRGRILFLVGTPEPVPVPVGLPAEYDWELWRPSWGQVRPPGLGYYPFAIWWLFHVCRIFANREYGVFLIRHGKRCVHRSLVIPRFFRFPFMTARDLQIGDVWTAEFERGRGLATFALLSILSSDADRQRRYWYLTDESNPISAGVAERAKFRLAALGARKSFFGLRVLGTYEIEE